MTAGGRVLNVTGLGATPGEARDRAYAAAEGSSSTAARCGRTSPPAQWIGSRRERHRGVHGRPGDGETEVEHQFDELDVDDAPQVGIVMGSKSDMPLMEKAAQELEERGIRHEMRVMSAHRDPDTVAEYAKNARMRGLRVIIAGAGLAAALPGVVAAHTDLPVIGVPLTSKTSVAGGLDALLAIAQMPPGVPVATVGVDNPKNAAVLAARILAA